MLTGDRLPSIPALTSLRFFAAFYVALTHYRLVLEYPAAIDPLIAHGGGGVVLFFMLSGFVLTYNYERQFERSLAGYGAFLWARFARVVPLHWLALLAVTPLVLAVAGRVDDRLALSWLLNATLLHSFVPWPAFHIWNQPSWSLSCELLFYLVLPALLRFVLAPASRRFSVSFLLALTYSLGVLAALVATLLDRGSGLILIFSPPLYLWVFVLGCLLAIAYLRPAGSFVARLQASRLLRDGLLLGSLALWVAIAWRLVPASSHTYGLPLFGIITALACGPTYASRLLTSRPLLLLGEASYSLYLFHWLPLFTLALAFGANDLPVANIWWATVAPGARTTLPAPLALLALAGTVAASVGLYLGVEMPARRWLRARPWFSPVPTQHPRPPSTAHTPTTPAATP